MPRTEAGKRLYDETPWWPDKDKDIEAIEDEAIRRAHEGDAEFLDDLLADERARIRVAVEDLRWRASIGQKELIERDAVLAIIDKP